MSNDGTRSDGREPPDSRIREPYDVEAGLERLRSRIGDGQRADSAGGRTPGAGSAADVVSPYGRDDTLRLVAGFLYRAERGAAPDADDYPNPVIVLEGPRGIGKTSLLAALEERLDQHVPYASIDCEVFSGDARQLLSVLAFDLSRRSDRRQLLRFPRLITGQIAISAQLSKIDPAAARDQMAMQQLLEGHERSGSALQEAVGGTLNAALGGAQTFRSAGPAIADLVGRQSGQVVLGRLAATRRGRRLLLGKGQEWYGHQDRGLGRNHLDVLVDLNRMAARPDAGAKRAVAELLWSAFLADLRDTRSSRRFRDWSGNCAVLLDNADTPSGRGFLAGLIAARSLREAADADRLTVIATSRGTLSERIRGEGATALADASHDDYLRQRKARSRWWYPVALPSLTLRQTEVMVEALHLPGPVWRGVATMVHRFTSGHPGSTRSLLHAIAEHPDKQGDLLGLLGEPDTTMGAPGHRTVEESLLSRLLDGIPPGAVDDLATCSGARDRGAALRLASRNGPLIQVRAPDSAVFSDELWTAETPGDRRELHPLLRRLLLRRLARRGDGMQANWAHVHTFLQRDSQATGDTAGDLHHALALGQVEYVARHFTRSLEDTNATEWLQLLRSVTAAPNRLDHRQPLVQQLDALTSWTQPKNLPLAAVGRLIAASWICSDPLSMSYDGQLYEEIASELHLIAPYCPKADASAMHGEAVKHQRVAAEE